MTPDLLTPIVSEDKFHRHFRALMAEDLFHGPARDMLREIWAAFPNPDKHFVKEFQTTHFDARIWELYIFAVGHFADFKVSRPTKTPDFLFEADGMDVWIEATTANPSEKRPPPKPAATVDESFHEMHNIIPIRFGGPLTTKLGEKYWERAHVAGKPLVFAIGDFATDFLIRTSDSGLVRYLYGIEGEVVSLPGEPVKIEYSKVDEHEHEGKRIPSGFFNLPGAEYVSAVIFSNEGTLPKFGRMAFDFKRYPRVRMVRVGTCTDHDVRATYPRAFGFLVGDASEDWGTGVHVYHNPKAVHPIPLDFFGNIGGQHWMTGGALDGELREFSPYSSVTYLFEAKPGEESMAPRDAELRMFARMKAYETQKLLQDNLEFLAWRNKTIDLGDERRR